MFIRSVNTLILLSIVILSTVSSSVHADEPIFIDNQIHHPVVAKKGMVVTDDEYATKAGIKVLEEGGNAIDAAVTIGFVMAVTYPRAGNLGGGGFMLIHDSDSEEVIALDYREKAPKKSTHDMFLDKHGDVDRDRSRNSILSSGVPGTVAGLAVALEKFGTISLEKALEPAIGLAENGVPVSFEMRSSLVEARERLEKSDESISVFFKEDGTPYEVGEKLRQPALAWTLRQIASDGIEAFYKGSIAKKISAFMSENSGLITVEDLSSYEPVIRKPVKGNYRGYEIYSMPPPSSGGVHLIQMLNMLEKFPLTEYSHNSARPIHLLTEVMKLAYADRSRHLGDPDFEKVPSKHLISEKYAKRLVNKIDMNTATPSSEIEPGDPGAVNEGENTTHFSVIDKHGNAVSNTYTLNFSYGSGITVPGTGILLNNEMDDFSSKPGVPNAYGLIGGKYNAIEPEKRMLSSMTPTIVMKDNKPYIVTGSPGGSRIITTVLQVILNVVDHNMNIATATAVPRIHHQWFPDKTQIEEGISSDTLSILEKMGHDIEIGRTIGAANSIMYRDGYYYGYSDPRRPGSLCGGIN